MLERLVIWKKFPTSQNFNPHSIAKPRATPYVIPHRDSGINWEILTKRAKVYRDLFDTPFHEKSTL